MTYQEYVDAIAAQEEGEEPIVNPYEVILRADTTSISDKAFSIAGIVSIRIPDTTTYIGSNAFYNCTALTSIRMPSFLETLGEYAFYGCNSLITIYIPGTIVDIPQFAFRGCRSLRSVVFGAGIQTIGVSAFSGCDILNQFYYTGNKSDWQNIEIDDSNTDLFAVKNSSYGYEYTPEPFELEEEEV